MKNWNFWHRTGVTPTAQTDKSVLNMEQKAEHFDPNTKGKR